MHILLYSKSGLEMENSGMESCCISFHLYRRYGLHYNILLEMMSVFTRSKGVNERIVLQEEDQFS